jgi:predicted O-methyltransferase YrrM
MRGAERRSELGELLGAAAVASAVRRLRQLRGDLRPAWREYTRTVSSPPMAVSLQAAALCAYLCEHLQPRRIADLGSGFSTVVFARHARTTACDVVSVDDDDGWLRRTEHHLDRLGLRVAFLGGLGDFEPSAAFDLVFYDLGRMPVRERRLQWATSLVAEGGLVVIDDLHKPDYAEQVRRHARAENLQLIELRAATVDRFGRYVGVARPCLPKSRTP